MAGTDIFKAWMVEPCCCQMILDCDVELVRVEMVDTMQVLWFYMELFPYFNKAGADYPQWQNFYEFTLDHPAASHGSGYYWALSELAGEWRFDLP